MDDALQVEAVDGGSGVASGVRCGRLIGCAGSGKSYTLAQRTKADPAWGMLCATTGISAINIGAVTLNSRLGYFDLASMRDAYLSGQLARRLHDIALDFRTLVVEEYSMLGADALDLLYAAVAEANRYRDVVHPLGILLVGDLAQLPPVKERWCFEAGCWENFAASTERLDRVWRQDGGPFLDALNMVRAGRGGDAADLLSQIGVEFHSAIDTEFDGTTILPTNKQVNRYNKMALARLKGPVIEITARRWGKQRSEWGLKRAGKWDKDTEGEWGIAPITEFKLGAYVMILANRTEDFSVVNGDCGYVRDADPAGAWLDIEMVRTGKLERIGKIVRHVDQRDAPADWNEREMVVPRSQDIGEFIQRRHFRGGSRRYVLGQIEWLPVKLAFASTVHKTQSLSLDRIQCDYRDRFFGSEAMLYTALSRCRTLGGLRLVGMKEIFAKQCKMDSRVLPWL